MLRLVAWFARNSVASNLVLLMMVFGGLLSLTLTMRIEAFPSITPENINVTVAYPGATPTEVEESICIEIEEAVEGIEGVDRIRSTASENIGVVAIEIVDGADITEVLDEIKNAVDAIDTFPDDAEEPTIEKQTVEERVIGVVLHGATGERNLRVLAEELRDDLLGLPGVSKAELEGAREHEISIEVEEQALRGYRLRFSDVTRAVQDYSINLPAGSVRTRGGEIIFRSSSQAYTRRDFEKIPLRTLADGTRVLLEDIATVRFGFEETDQATRFDGNNALLIQVYRVGNENTPTVAAAVRELATQAQSRLPDGVELDLWRDQSEDLAERLDLLKRNGIQGLLLVILVLALFLRARLAIWVAIGLVAALFGAAWVMPWFDLSLNFLSTFGFILVLGILVDDAIVVGENIDAHRSMGKDGARAAIDGAQEVMVPVCLAVVTTGIAFSPMLSLPGRTGDFAGTIAKVVIIAIGFSLVESLLVLPSHLSHSHSSGAGGLLGRVSAGIAWTFTPLRLVWRRIQAFFTGLLQATIDRAYKPTLEFVIRWHYFTIACGAAFVIVTGGLFGGGWVKVTFFPPIEGNDVICTVRFPEGTDVEKTEAAVAIIESVAADIRAQVEGDAARSVVLHTRSTIGEQPGTAATGPPAPASPSQSRGNVAEVHMELVSAKLRDVTSSEIARRWRDGVTRRIPDAEELTFSADQINVGAPINIELSGKRMEELRAAAEELEQRLDEIPGTFDITDDYRPGKPELSVRVTPSGAAIGLTQLDIAQQVRRGFYGDEAQRVQLGRDNVKVFIRYPEDERRSLANLESMRIRVAGPEIGTPLEAPFSEVANYDIRRGPATIRRIDRQRTIVVTADLDLAVANANEIRAELERSFFPDMVQRHPSVRYAFGGEQSNQAESFSSLFSGMILALFLMFGLLAVVFRSWIQPLIVLSAIPFGVGGAVWAHFLLGMNLTFLSMIGILALMGVVVNDSLVMIDFINRFRRSHGMDLLAALRQAGPRRFRPILLTSLTTFAGLTPILLERSVQAAFVIPMAVSLAFGVAFATFVILVIVPASYLAVEDIRRLITGHGEELPALDDQQD